LYDLTHVATGDEKHNYWLLMEILTPIVKTYSSEHGSRSAALAIQTLGGYGFTTDFPVQQHYRDLKIMSLYEGTTGIQAIDLLGRKVTMEKGNALHILAATIQATIAEASQDALLKDSADQLAKDMKTIEKVLTKLYGYSLQGKIEQYLSDATVFLEMMSFIVIGWQWLKMSIAARKKLSAPGLSISEKQFYQGKIQTLEFYCKYEMPHVSAFANTLMNEKELTNIKDFPIFD
jgi:butyryl-CoA dehydrogenase